MTDRKFHDDDVTDALFAEARGPDPVPDAGLMARVLADADRLQPPPAHAPARTQPQVSAWAQFLDTLGGWPALGGLVASGAAGLWLGLVPPTGIETLTAQVLGRAETVTFMPDTTPGTLAPFEEMTDG